MNGQQFWQLVEAARDQARHPDDAEDVAHRATERLATRPAEEIVAAQQVLWDLMADSCTNPLWAAAYLINGGCSDDGFDYFRGWLISAWRPSTWSEREACSPGNGARSALGAGGNSPASQASLSPPWPRTA
ncbi:DUF4240 domain-containing protein [Streptomyces werraensis]